MIAVRVMALVVATAGQGVPGATGIVVMSLLTSRQQPSSADMATYLMAVSQSEYTIKVCKEEKPMSKIAKHILVVCGLLVVTGTIIVISKGQVEAGISEVAPPTIDPSSIDEQYLTPQPRIPVEKIIGGTIIEIDGDSIIADSSKHGLVTLYLSNETRIWRGEWGNELPIEVGDYFFGYGEPDKDGTIWKMEQMEVNIVNLRGAIVSTEETSEGVTLQLEDVHENELYTVHVTSNTLLVSDEGQAIPFARAQVDLESGNGVQVIGLKLKDGTVVATRIF